MENRAKDLELDFLALGRHLVRHGIWLAVAVAVGIATGWVTAKMMQKRYYAEVIFVPDKSTSFDQAMPSLGLLTGKLGLPGEGSESPFFSHFEDFLKTRNFSEGLLDLVRKDSSAALLEKAYGGGVLDSLSRFRGVAAKALKATRKDGLYRIECTTVDPRLSYALAGAAYAAFEKKLRDARMESLMRNLGFLEDLVSKNRVDLEKNSDELRRFLERNRDVSSPQLSLARQEIMMNVKLAEEKYVLSIKEHETLKIKREKDEGTIVVIEPAFMNSQPIYPVPAKFMAIGAFIFLLAALAILSFLGRRRWITLNQAP